MAWTIYENARESTQIFIGILLILAIAFVVLLNVYFWVKEKLKK